MILVTLAMLAQSVSPQPPAHPVSESPPAQNDITVVARKLGNLDIVLKRRRGAYYCRYRQRSDDAALDAAACTAAIDCFIQSSDRTAFRACVTTAMAAFVTPGAPPP